MKKAFPIATDAVRFGLRGRRHLHHEQGLRRQAPGSGRAGGAAHQTTPDAAIPNVLVQDATTAKVMADIIDHHSREATGGRTYAEMGRFLAKDGGDTSYENLTVKDASGQPVANPFEMWPFRRPRHRPRPDDRGAGRRHRRHRCCAGWPGHPRAGSPVPRRAGGGPVAHLARLRRVVRNRPWRPPSVRGTIGETIPRISVFFARRRACWNQRTERLIECW